MNTLFKDNKIIIDDITDFDIKQSCECGQCFRWTPYKDGYRGIIKDCLITVSQEGKSKLIINGADKDKTADILDYFDLNRDYSLIKQAYRDDEILSKASAYGWGIRVFKQDIWEALISFIISSNNNIPRIRGIIERLCEGFGEKKELNGEIYYKFPDIKTLASLNEADLSAIRAGFRTKYIMDAAEKVYNKEVDIYSMTDMPYEDAKNELIKIKGVGNKVADCVLLFGAHRLEAFPVDVWIKRMLENYYGAGYDVKRFGKYAGVAQQYLFYYGRDNKIK